MKLKCTLFFQSVFFKKSCSITQSNSKKKSAKEKKEVEVEKEKKEVEVENEIIEKENEVEFETYD